MFKALYLLYEASGKDLNDGAYYLLKVAKVLGIGTLSLAIVAATGLFFLQRTLIYPSSIVEGSRTKVDLPYEFGMTRYEQVMLKTIDNVQVHGYLIKSQRLKCSQTIVFLHANAGNMGHRLPVVKLLYDALNCNIFMLSYRGYGLSEGSPSEQGIQKDVDAALVFLAENENTRGNRLYFYGQSIGGAVAIDTCYRYAKAKTLPPSLTIAGLIVENTFTSLPDMVADLFPILSFASLLLLDRWDSKSKISHLAQIPILFLAGKKDTLVPPAQMRALYASSRSSPLPIRSFIEFQNGDHNNTCVQPGYFDHISSWFAKLD
ncbi:hypothetical protein BB561_000384 [Smittium simulii]|uniref:Serine aminopeptidase S33 domain-containing protein n=1 Tax=Smittium simulii TaxID=133385 RepID=A0A2T9YZB7_9FUNG|nr:hypothetical protein BB561_000384 [Smittium simulii]